MIRGTWSGCCSNFVTRGQGSAWAPLGLRRWRVISVGSPSQGGDCRTTSTRCGRGSGKGRRQFQRRSFSAESGVRSFREKRNVRHHDGQKTIVMPYIPLLSKKIGRAHV